MFNHLNFSLYHTGCILYDIYVSEGVISDQLLLALSRFAI